MNAVINSNIFCKKGDKKSDLCPEWAVTGLNPAKQVSGTRLTGSGLVGSRQIPDELSEKRDPYRSPDLQEPGPGRREHAIRIFSDLSGSSLSFTLSLSAVYPKGITFPLGSCLSWTNSRNLSPAATGTAIFPSGWWIVLSGTRQEASSIFYFIAGETNPSKYPCFMDRPRNYASTVSHFYFGQLKMMNLLPEITVLQLRAVSGPGSELRN